MYNTNKELSNKVQQLNRKFLNMQDKKFNFTPDDDFLFGLINSIEDCLCVVKLLPYLNFLPKTDLKIQDLINCAIINNPNSINFNFYRLQYFFNNKNRNMLIDAFLEDRYRAFIDRIDILIDKRGYKNLEIFNKCLSLYKKERVWKYLIGKSFLALRGSDLENACKILKKTTANLCVLLLLRDDLGEEYKFIGLKALAKLSNKSENIINIKVKKEMIKELKPKDRAQVIEYILSSAPLRLEYFFENSSFILKNCSRAIRCGRKFIEFESLPTKEEILELLFEVGLKENSKINFIKILYKNYVDFLNKKGEKNDKSNCKAK